MVSLTFLYVIREIIGFLEPGRTKANSVIFPFFASQKLAIVSRFPNFGGGGIKLISFDWFLSQLQISSSHAKYKLTKVFLPQWNFIQRYPVNMTANWLKNAIVCFSLISLKITKTKFHKYIFFRSCEKVKVNINFIEIFLDIGALTLASFVF